MQTTLPVLLGNRGVEGNQNAIERIAGSVIDAVSPDEMAVNEVVYRLCVDPLPLYVGVAGWKTGDFAIPQIAENSSATIGEPTGGYVAAQNCPGIGSPAWFASSTPSYTSSPVARRAMSTCGADG